jgi:ABC-type branched-subunit amino acid transport system ATPase component
MSEPPAPPLLRLHRVRKGYGALRPLRIEELAVASGERLSLFGFDAVSAEVFVNLVTGAALPDDGGVEVCGRPTSDVVNGGDWLAALDRFGLLTDRIVLLDALTVAQNLAIPFTLAIDPLGPDARARVARLAREVELDQVLDRPAVDITPSDRARLRLGRALALDPLLVLLEHPTASVPAADVRDAARLIARLADHRGCAVVALTTDDRFARSLGGRRLTLEPATGALRGRSTWPWGRQRA